MSLLSRSQSYALDIQQWEEGIHGYHIMAKLEGRSTFRITHSSQILARYPSAFVSYTWSQSKLFPADMNMTQREHSGAHSLMFSPFFPKDSRLVLMEEEERYKREKESDNNASEDIIIRWGGLKECTSPATVKWFDPLFFEHAGMFVY